MHDLIQQLIDKTGISQEQANSVIGVIKEFVHEKAPMISGTVNQLLDGEGMPGGVTDGLKSKLEDGLGGLGGKLGGFFGS